MNNKYSKYYRELLLALVFIVRLTLCSAQAPNWAWANSLELNGTNNQNAGIYALTLDATGNSYVTGVFYDTIMIGNTYLISRGESDIFLAKYSPQGNVLWATRAGSRGNDVVNDICMDSHNNLYICGGYYDTIQFGTHYLYGNQAENTFIAEYDPNSGSCTYVRQIGTAVNLFNFKNIGTGVLTKIRIDSTENFYLTGVVGDPYGVDFGGQEGLGTFVVKYDQYFNLYWVSYIIGAVDYTSLIKDNNGNAYVAGMLTDTASCQAYTLPASGNKNNTNEFMVKFDNSYGALGWDRLISGPNIYPGPASENNGVYIYVSGTFEDTCIFDSTHKFLYNSSRLPSYIAKYDFNGNVIWTKEITGANLNFLTDDKNGNIVIIGSFDYNLTINDSVFLKPNEHNFIALLDTSGTLQWIRFDTIFHSGFDYGLFSTASFDNADNLIVAGNVYSIVILGNDTLKGTYIAPKSFIAKLGNNIQGISNPSLNPATIKLFPNPASNQLTITGSSLSISSIQIDNILGQQVASLAQNYASNQNISIDVNSLTSGIYFISWHTNKGVVVNKFVKE